MTEFTPQEIPADSGLAILAKQAYHAYGYRKEAESVAQAIAQKDKNFSCIRWIMDQNDIFDVMVESFMVVMDYGLKLHLVRVFTHGDTLVVKRYEKLASILYEKFAGYEEPTPGLLNDKLLKRKRFGLDKLENNDKLLLSSVVKQDAAHAVRLLCHPRKGMLPTEIGERIFSYLHPDQPFSLVMLRAERYLGDFCRGSVCKGWQSGIEEKFIIDGVLYEGTKQSSEITTPPRHCVMFDIGFTSCRVCRYQQVLRNRMDEMLEMAYFEESDEDSENDSDEDSENESDEDSDNDSDPDSDNENEEQTSKKQRIE